MLSIPTPVKITLVLSLLLEDFKLQDKLKSIIPVLKPKTSAMISSSEEDLYIKIKKIISYKTLNLLLKNHLSLN